MTTGDGLPRVPGLSTLRSRLHGQVLSAGDADFEASRRVFNAMVERRPTLIVRATSTADVQTTIEFAREKNLPLSVRGGGHSVAGYGVCDGGVVLDLTRMRVVEVDRTARTVRVGGGAVWADVDRATAQFGLATPGGVVSSTGVGGLTLGGGVGWLVRRFGLACDNLLSVDLVTADSALVVVDERHNPDLLWGLRGGGGNFGVAASLVLRLHPLGTVLGGAIIYPYQRARTVLEQYPEMVLGAPDCHTWSVALRSHGGVPVVSLLCCLSGSRGGAGEALTAARNLGSPVEDRVRELPYWLMQRELDADFPPGMRHYWKSCFLPGVGRDLVEVLVDVASRSPSTQSIILLESYTGQVTRLPESACAYPHRGRPFHLHVLACWADPADDALNVAWARRVYGAVRPYAMEGAYANFMGSDEGDVAAAAFGGNQFRLASLKRRYDPENTFRNNVNLVPST